MPDIETINANLLYMIALTFGAIIGLSALLFLWVVRRVKRVNLPVGAGFWLTLRATPFSVVLLLDLLDLGLDFLSAPIAWVLLSRLGLTPLRGVSVIESVIPGTQFLPTMTISWIMARFMKKR